jgi:hypothetical protein
VWLQSPKSKPPSSKKSDTTNTQTPKIRSNPHIQNSNFRFKLREKRTQGSERCEKDRTANREFLGHGEYSCFCVKAHVLQNSFEEYIYTAFIRTNSRFCKTTPSHSQARLAVPFSFFTSNLPVELWTNKNDSDLAHSMFSCSGTRGIFWLPQKLANSASC